MKRPWPSPTRRAARPSHQSRQHVLRCGFERLEDRTLLTATIPLTLQPDGSATQAGDLASSTAVDVYQFVATVTGQMTLAASPVPGSSLTTQLQVFDAAQDLLATGFGSASFSGPASAWVVAGQSYSLEVADGTGSGGYTLVLAPMLSTPTPTPPQAGTISAPGGTDLYAFTAPVTGTLIVTLAPAPGSPLVPRVTALDAALRPVGSGATTTGSPASQLILPVSAGQTDYLQVAADPAASAGHQVGGYRLTAAFTQQATGAHQTLATADETAPGVAVTGTLAAGGTDYYRIDPGAGQFVAQLQAPGTPARLSLLNAQGQVLVQSDGQSAGDPDPLIDQYLPVNPKPNQPFPFYLEVQSLGGAGSYTLTTTLTPEAAPFQPVPVSPASQTSPVAVGSFTSDGLPDLVAADGVHRGIADPTHPGHGAGTFQDAGVLSTIPAGAAAYVPGHFGGGAGTDDLAVLAGGHVSVLWSRGDGTFATPVALATTGTAVAVVAGSFGGDGGTDLAVADASGTVTVYLNRGGGRFVLGPPIALGFAPTALAAGDFTGDGAAELAVTGAGRQTVTILRIGGGGTLTPRAALAVPFVPSLLAAGDVNGDGTADLAVAGSGSPSVAVFLGRKDGSFAVAPTIGLGFTPTALVSGDFNGDGTADLAALDAGSNSVAVLVSDGDGTFQAPVHYAVGGAPAGLAVGDVNGDRRLDLVIGDGRSQGPTTQDLTVLLGRGDGTFQDPQQFAVGNRPAAIVTADFNRDNRLDLAVANEDSNSVSVLLGKGDGTFQSQVQYAVGSRPDSIAVADFNQDGRKDLAVADAGSRDVRVLFGLGDGGFAQQQETLSVGGTPSAVVAGDFNGDGHQDLAVADGGAVEIFLGEGNGQFATPFALSLPAGLTAPTGLAAGDFTGDGVTDLAVIGQRSSVVGIYGEQAHSLGLLTTFRVGGPALSLTTGDFNGPGKADLAVGDQLDEVTVVSFGAGGWTLGKAQTTAVRPDALTTGDYLGNHVIDLVAIQQDNSAGPLTKDVALLLGKGDGTFLPPVAFPAATYTTAHSNPTAVPYPTAIVSGDFNRDGLDDVAIGRAGSNDLFVLLGPSQKSFAVGSKPSAVLTGDFNGDGHPDIAVANAGSDSVSILLNANTPDGAFFAQAAYPVGNDPVALAMGNFTGPGHGNTDLAVADAGSDAITILEDKGDGTFTALAPMALGFAPTALVAGDFNGDGVTDLAVLGQGLDTVAVLLGEGGGRFAAPVSYAVGAGPDALAAADFNGDGPIDLAVADAGSNAVTILAGRGNGTFAAQAPIAVGKQPDALAVGDFNGDGKPDLAVGNAGDDTVEVLLNAGSGLFESTRPQPLAAGISPTALVTGSFAQDGNSDLVVLSQGSATATVYIGTGVYASTIGPLYEIAQLPVMIAAGSIAGADFNGDGWPDLAYTGPGQTTVTEQINPADGTFASFADPSQLPTALRATPVTIDGLTAPGITSSFVIDTQGQILWRQEQSPSSGTFGFPTVVNASSSDPPARDIAAVATATGWMIASLDAKDNNLTLYAFDPATGSFTFHGQLPTGHLPAQVLAADLDGSGQPRDLVVRNAGDDSLTVYLGDGKGGFGHPISVSVGFGVSDVAVADVDGDGRPDLIVTNQNAGTVAVLINQGGGKFAGPVTYQAGGGLRAVDAINFITLDTSLDATAGAVAVTLDPARPADLVTLNPGANALGLLAGLGRGRFANPVNLPTVEPGSIVRAAVLGDNGAIPDLIVLDARNITVYRQEQGGFTEVSSISAGLDPTGLTVADIDGKPALLVGNPYGDQLVLLSQGDGTFRPAGTTQHIISLAAADTATGQKLIVYANQDKNTISVQEGVKGTITTLAGPSDGLLAPAKVLLKDLNGDGISDLIVVNSGGNNVLVYPGLGNDRFGPALNGGAGYFTGTDPVDVQVADVNGDGRPDLVVTNQGSNDVSVLLNQPVGNSFTFAPGPRLQAGYGPTSATVTQQSNGLPNIVVSDSQSNDVRIIPGIGNGFFNDQNPTIVPINDPGTIYSGPGGRGVLLTPGTSGLTLLTGLNGPNPAAQTIGLTFTPTVAWSDPTLNLVVAAGPGQTALLQAGEVPLVESNSAVANPTALVLDAEGSQALTLLLANADVEAAIPLTFALEGPTEPPPVVEPGGLPGSGGVLSVLASNLGGPEPVFGLAAETETPAATASVQQVVQLLPESSTSLALIATLITVSVEESAVGVTASEAATGGLPGGAAGPPPNQPLSRANQVSRVGEEAETSGGGDSEDGPPVVPRASAWLRLMLGIDEAFEQSAEELGAKPASPKPPGPTGRLDAALDALLSHWPARPGTPEGQRPGSPGGASPRGRATREAFAGRPGPGIAAPAAPDGGNGGRPARMAETPARSAPPMAGNVTTTAISLAVALAAAGGIVPPRRHGLGRSAQGSGKPRK